MSHDPPDPSPGPSPQPPAAPGGFDPQFLEEFQTILGSWAEATSARDPQATVAIAQRIGELVDEHVLKNPTPELQFQIEADELENRSDWPGAEVLRRKVLGLAETGGDSAPLATAQLELSRLLSLVGRGQEAWEFAVAATASARRVDVFALLSIILQNEANCALDLGRFPEALAAATEAVQVLAPEKLTELIRARALTTLARGLLAANDSAGAELQLLLAGELLQDQTSPRVLFPGQANAMASWWEAKGQLAVRQGDLAGALDALNHAIVYRRMGDGPFARFALARTLVRLGAIAGATGDFTGEELVLNEARRIREDLKLSPNWRLFTE